MAPPASFFGLADTDDDAVRQMTVVPRICSGIGAMFGGVGLGACLDSLETYTNRPVVWATGQFLSFAYPPAELEVAIDEVVRGRRTSQARAVVRDTSAGGTEILTVNAALGTRPDAGGRVYEAMPEVPRPAECPSRDELPYMRNTIAEHMEIRLADARDFDELPGPPGNGRSALWVRMKDEPHGIGTAKQMPAPLLAIVGDYVPFGISQALGRRAGGNSLDNTIRVVDRHPSEWILADVQIHAIAGGFGHGLVHLWSEDGRLLATASQSTIVRNWEDAPTPTPANDAAPHTAPTENK